jgi:hypothetical protein
MSAIIAHSRGPRAHNARTISTTLKPATRRLPTPRASSPNTATSTRPESNRNSPLASVFTYTTFAYKNLAVSPAKVAGDQKVTVSFDVTDTGTRAGAEVAEDVGEKHASVPRPVKELKGFSKVFLKPGETQHVSVTLDRRAFAYYDEKQHDWTADAAQFDILVGSSSAQIELTGKVTR